MPSSGIEVVQLDSLDAFGRARVSNPVTVMDCSFQYDLQPLIFESQVSGSGNVAHDADHGAVILSCGSGVGAAKMQSRQYCTYQKGKSHLIEMTGSLKQAAGAVTWMGYGDSQNGVFYECDEQGAYFRFRSSVTGSTVDTIVRRDQWDNHGVLEDLDVETSQILVIDLQWLGVGLVRIGFNRNGKFEVAHKFRNDNRTPATYWTTATLPVQYGIESDGTGAGASMVQICCSVQSEGGFQLERGFSFGATRSSEQAVTSRRPVLSIRPKTLFNAITNRQGVIPRSFDVLSNNNGAIIELVYNGTLTGASWNDADPLSSVEYDQSATAISGGTVIWKGISGSSGPKSFAVTDNLFPNILWLTNNIAGNATTSLTMVATSIAATAGIWSAMHWIEIR